MERKITVIGAGSVGSTITYTLSLLGLCSEIIMIDVNERKAMGEAMDIRQGTPFCPPVKIWAGTYEDAVDSDIIIITSGMPRKPGMSRIDLTQTNIDVLKDIAGKIAAVAPNAIYIIVSNPVDILTYAFCKISGIPEQRIIGSGTILDTARLRSRLAQYANISEKSIHAYVLGEHGDSSFIPWSIAQVGGVNVLNYKGGFSYERIAGSEIHPEVITEEIEEYIKTSGAKIIRRKGATYYAIAVSVCHIVKCLYSGANTVLTVSSMMHAEYGIDDVCLSIPFIVGQEGIVGNALPQITEQEVAKLQHSADVLKGIIKEINF